MADTCHFNIGQADERLVRAAKPFGNLYGTIDHTSRIEELFGFHALASDSVHSHLPSPLFHLPVLDLLHPLPGLSSLHTLHTSSPHPPCQIYRSLCSFALLDSCFSTCLHCSPLRKLEQLSNKIFNLMVRSDYYYSERTRNTRHRKHRTPNTGTV